MLNITRNTEAGHRMNVMGKAALSIAAIAIAGMAAPAQAQNAQQPLVTETQTTGSWSVRCYRSGPFLCDMTQVDIDRSRNALVASISVSYNPKADAYLGRFLMPLGVSFDQGLAIDIGQFHAAGIKYRVCGRDGCLAINILPPQLIEAMQSGGSGKGVMRSTLINGQKIEIPILLDGFSESLDQLKKLTDEKLASAEKTGKK
jgi:invasion protein IalB